MAVWLAGTIWMAAVATENFFTITRLIEAKAHPQFVADLNKLGVSEMDFLLKYLSSELNRLFFQVWGLTQIAVGILALWFIGSLPNSGRSKWMVVSMLGICLLFAALVTPQIVSVGRSLDFVVRDPAPPQMRTFGLLHATYTVLDGIKLILGAIVTVWLLKRPAESEA